MEEETYSMVQELTNSYVVGKPSNGTFKIEIEAPKKYRSIWMSKLSNLRTTMKEIEYYEKDE